MSDPGQDSKLVLRAEAALAAARLAREPDWEALAERIEDALGAAGASDDSLLLPPLPESIEDGREELAPRAMSSATTSESATGPESQRGGASLAELARAAVARRSSKEAVSLARESLAIASQGRVQPEPPPVPVPATIVVESERRTVPPSRRQRDAFDARGPWIGVAIATVGLAAGFGLYLASRSAPTPTNLTAAPVAAGAKPATTSAAAATTAPPPKLAATPEAAAPEAKATVTSAPVDPPAPIEAVPAGALPHESLAARTGAPAAEPRASGARVRAEKVVLDDEPKAAATSTAAKPAASGAMRPAELNTSSGGISDRPSTGAAQAAVGSVLGAARACVAGQPEASSATLVFGSSGEVKSVSVSGPAEGTPAAACIKAALGKARVQPFAAPTFSLGVTVRPQ
jgi:hypothetical protein